MKKSARLLIKITIIVTLILLLPIANGYALDQATIKLNSGATYSGETVLGSIPSGSGTVAWPDGGKYTGMFFNGMPSGKGTLTYSNGDVYTGQFEYGFRSGKGTMIFANGDSYIGEWKADMMHGQGKYIFHSPDAANPEKNDVFTGQWRYNMMHGKGSYRYANGSSTNGYWVENQYRGAKITNSIREEIGALDQ